MMQSSCESEYICTAQNHECVLVQLASEATAGVALTWNSPPCIKTADVAD